MRNVHLSLSALAALIGLAAAPGMAHAQYWRGYGDDDDRYERPFARPYAEPELGYYGYRRPRPVYVVPPPVVYAPPPPEFYEPPAIFEAPPRYRMPSAYRTPIVHRVIRPRPVQHVACTCHQPAAAILTPRLPALRPPPPPPNNAYSPEMPGN